MNIYVNKLKKYLPSTFSRFTYTSKSWRYNRKHSYSLIGDRTKKKNCSRFYLWQKQREKKMSRLFFLLYLITFHWTWNTWRTLHFPISSSLLSLFQILIKFIVNIQNCKKFELISSICLNGMLKNYKINLISVSFSTLIW